MYLSFVEEEGQNHCVGSGLNRNFVQCNSDVFHMFLEECLGFFAHTFKNDISQLEILSFTVVFCGSVFDVTLDLSD